MEQQDDFVAVTFSWWGAVWVLMATWIFFELREYAIGLPDRSVLTPFIDSFVPHHLLVVILWGVAMAVPLSWFLGRALIKNDYLHGFGWTYTLGLLVVPWAMALLNLPIVFFLPSYALSIKFVDAILLTAWFIIVATLTIILATKVYDRMTLRLGGYD